MLVAVAAWVSGSKASHVVLYVRSFALQSSSMSSIRQIPMSKPEHTEYTIVVSAQERHLLIEALNKLLEIEAESLQVPPKSYNETLIAAAATPEQRQRIEQLCELGSALWKSWRSSLAKEFAKN
jgi:hypothetical protein